MQPCLPLCGKPLNLHPKKLGGHPEQDDGNDTYGAGEHQPLYNCGARAAKRAYPARSLSRRDPASRSPYFQGANRVRGKVFTGPSWAQVARRREAVSFTI